MSKKYVGTNKGSTTVGANFNATATAFTVATGEGARLPAPTGGDYTLMVLQNTAGVREIICVVGRTGDVCTVGIPGSAAANVAGRNYEAIYGMAAASWVIGDVVSVRPTAELIEAGVNFGDTIAAATNKATPVDADKFAMSDSADSNASSYSTWANIKATLLTYFDTIFGVIRQNSKSAAYTTVLTDAGKHILHPSADTTARTFTIDSNANVAYPLGTVLTFINQSGAGVVTIAITADTMRLAGVGTTGSRTLAANGIASAIKIATTEWIISGAGLS